MRDLPRSTPFRVLLDENIDRFLQPHFPSDIDVETVAGQGWTGITDKDLLQRASRLFDVLVTMDQSLPYQQHLPAFDIAVVVLKASSNAFPDVVELMPNVREAIYYAETGDATFVTE